MSQTSQREQVINHAASDQIGAVTMSGLQRVTHSMLTRPTMRVFGKYAIIYLVDGEGRFEDSLGYTTAIRPGDLMFVFPEIGHRYGPQSHQTWNEFYLVFEGPIFDLWRQSGLLNPDRPVHHVEPVDYWLDRFESVLGAPREPGYSPPLLEVCRLQTALAEALVGGPKGPAYPEQMQWVSRACALLDSDLRPGVGIDSFAERFGMTPDSFRKRFTRVLGISPARYRAKRMIDRACRLMASGQLTDKQIADQLGFCDEFHFSRRFKQMTGVNPRTYRKRLPGVM